MDVLSRQDRAGVAHILMDAPERLNALSDEMIAGLQRQFDELRDSTEIRAVILSGAGKAFCAGHDLKQMTNGRQAPDGGREYFKDLFDRCAAMMLAIRDLPQPVIAQVHGIATAAGCQLVASCDMAVAADDARFGVNGVNIGLFCSTPMVALSRNVPRKRAFEMLVTGEFVGAAEARELGLVNRVTSPERLEAETRELAETVAKKLASAVRVGKRAFYEQLELGLADAYAHTGSVMVGNMLDRDTEEGIAAFIEKRPAAWARE